VSPDVARPIIVAYDGSPPSQAAVRVAAELFAGRPAFLVTVFEPGLALLSIPPTNTMPGMTPADIEMAEEVERAMEDHAARVAGEGVELARSLGLEARPLSVADEVNPGETISELAKERSAAAVVVGSRGLRGLRSRLHGSTSRHLLEHTTHPVLVVRADPE
jgi:nucleotide-binding universal stress UspA family protein